jgi:hypothetical protein
MGDGFSGLGHDSIIGCNDENDDIGPLSAARTHGSESRVAWRVQESDRPATMLDLVSADVLGDAANLPGGDIRVADSIQQGGLAVIDVAQNGDDRWAGMQVTLSLAGDHPTPQRHFALFFLF